MVRVAGYACHRLCSLVSRVVALDKGLGVGVRRGQQPAQTQHNCSRTNRTRQFCVKTPAMPHSINTTQYLYFSEGYKILHGPERRWYYSCYSVDGMWTV